MQSYNYGKSINLLNTNVKINHNFVNIIYHVFTILEILKKEKQLEKKI